MRKRIIRFGSTILIGICLCSIVGISLLILIRRLTIAKMSAAMQRNIANRFVWLLVSLWLLSGCSGYQTSPLPTAVPTPISVADLIAILDNPDAQGSDLTEAANQLQHWGSAAAPAVPGLRRALRYQYSYDARSSAAEALTAIGPLAKDAIPDLIQAVDDENPINAYAAIALGSIGSAASCAVPRLAKALRSDDSALRSGAAIALDAITGKELVDSADRLAITAARDHIAIFVDEPEGTISDHARVWWDQEGRLQNWGTVPCQS